MFKSLIHLEIDVLDAHDQPVQVVFLRVEDVRDRQYFVGLHVQLDKILTREVLDFAYGYPGI
jgi:hypothetical protein